MKKLLLIALLAIMSVGLASAVTVDCGSSTNKCDETELQPVVDELVSTNNNQDERLDANDEKNVEQDRNIQLARRKGRYNEKYNWNQDEDIATNSEGITTLSSTISNNAADWARDTSGTSFSRVLKYLENDFLSYLKGLFAPKSIVQEYDERFYELEAKLHLVSEGLPLTDENVEVAVGVLKSEDHTVASTSSLDCVRGVCVSIN